MSLPILVGIIGLVSIKSEIRWDELYLHHLYQNPAYIEIELLPTSHMKIVSPVITSVIKSRNAVKI